MKDYLNTDEISEILGIPKRSAQRLIREGRINATRLGRDYRVHKEDLEQFIVDSEIGVDKTYYPLYEYLLNLKIETEILTLEKLRDIIGKSLPVSAYKYRSWFGNDQSHVQARAWMKAKWKVDSVVLGKSVTFVKVNE